MTWIKIENQGILEQAILKMTGNLHPDPNQVSKEAKPDIAWMMVLHQDNFKKTASYKATLRRSMNY